MTRFQYTVETGNRDNAGNEYVDDYIETYEDYEEAVKAYCAVDIERTYACTEMDIDLDEDEVVFKRLLAESLLDDDPDDYIQDSVVIAEQHYSVGDGVVESRPDDWDDIEYLLDEIR